MKDELRGTKDDVSDKSEYRCNMYQVLPLSLLITDEGPL